MAKSYGTFKKRQRERQRQEKSRLKRELRAQRRQEKKQLQKTEDAMGDAPIAYAQPATGREGVLFRPGKASPQE